MIRNQLSYYERRVRMAVVRRKKSEYLWIYIFLTPALVSLALFGIWPMVATGYFSFFRWNGIGWPSDFVGLKNYFELLKDPYFWNAFKNTFFYAFFQTLIKLPIALVLAVVLSETLMKAKSVYRALFFLPVILPTAVVSLDFKLILNPFTGPVNKLLTDLGIIDMPIDWFGMNLAMWTIIVVSTWQVTGRYMVYWLSGLQTVPRELYEAADIDGANSFQKFFYITLPSLKKFTMIIILLGFVYALRVFDYVKIMTDGGPAYRTDVVSTYIYRLAFESQATRLGYASAVAFFFAMVLLAIGITRTITNKG